MHKPFHGCLRTLDHVWCARSHPERDLFVDKCAPIDVADLLVSIEQQPQQLHEKLIGTFRHLLIDHESQL